MRGGAQILQPGQGLTAMRVFVQRRDEIRQSIADVQAHLRVGKNTPDGTRQILVTHFRDPAPAGIVDSQCQTRSEHDARLLGKAASGKIDVA
jgi:hypothetical protein